MRRWLWSWHRWLGLLVLLPLLWWVGTGFVFALWAIEHVRGRTFASGEKPEPSSLPSGLSLYSDALRGASSLTIKQIEGETIALVEKDGAPEIWDLPEWKLLGAALPVEWVKRIALRDFAPDEEPAEIWLYDRERQGRQLYPATNSQQQLPGEYAGPLPAYGVHFQKAGMHLYIDALSGEVRARRTSVWRFYDLAFRLHSLDFISEENDTPKRIILLVVAVLWLSVGTTGFWMWLRIFASKKRAKDAIRVTPSVTV